ncbi:MAG: bifunctional oligoribonuclease/PAP phosphatase NrnA [Nitrospirota bacterium]
MSLEKIKKCIKENNSFLISCHISPESDAIGSELALAILLEKLGKKVKVVNFDPVPNLLSFLPYAKKIIQEKEVTENFDVICVVDCGEIERTGLFKKDNSGCTSNGRDISSTIINIDHHITNTSFGHINWIDPDAVATCELIYIIAKSFNCDIDTDMAILLYTGIWEDTGGFRYANTKPDALRIAAELIEIGVNPSKIAEYLYEMNSFERLKLLGEILAGMEKSRDGKSAWVVVTQDLFKKTGTTSEDTEDMVNFPRSLKGVEVAMLLREIDPQSWKISFRSRGKVDVAKLAEKFDGGGHRQAAGCIVKGGMIEAKEKVLKIVEDEINSGS